MVEVQGGDGRLELSAETQHGPQDLPTDFRALRLMRFIHPIEGAPVWGVFGFLEWQLLFVVLLILYIVQVSARGRLKVQISNSNVRTHSAMVINVHTQAPTLSI